MADSGSMRIHILHCGQISVSRRAAYGGAGGALADMAAPASVRLELPVSVYLIEHPKGLILVDTGISRAMSPHGVYDAAAVRRFLPAHMAALLRPSVASGCSVGERLSALGVSPAELDFVLLTHLDPDHVSGLRELEGAGRIMAAEEDGWWNTRTVYHLRQPPLWEGLPLEYFWYKGSPIGPNRWAYDLFGDESVILVNVPGHTEGMFAVLLQNRGRYVLLTADAAFSSRSWQEMLVPGFGYNPVAQEKSLRWVRRMSLDPRCAAVLASHDPEEKPRLIEL